MPKETLEILPGLHWVGVKDWDRRMFDRLIPLPKGTSYNAYLIQGEGSTTLIDSVNPGFEDDLEKKISQLTNIKEIDYIVMNHAEPDHAHAIPYLLSRCGRAKVLTSKMGKKMAISQHHIPEDRIQIVSDQETIDLGGKTLRFIDAPWLHWPETMFTFYQERGILFPCDFFGCHLATSKFFDQEIGEQLANYAKSYFGEIMMPFRKRARRALDKLDELESSVGKLKMIAPSHGPIYKNPSIIINLYRKWTDGQVEKKVLIPYVSMWGSTERMAKVLIETIATQGVEVIPFNLSTGDLGDLAAELVDSAGIILGTPTMLGGAHPLIHNIAYVAKKLNPPVRYFGIIESHGWAPTAVKQLTGMLEDLDAELVGAVEILGSPTEDDLSEVVEFGKKFAEKISAL